MNRALPPSLIRLGLGEPVVCRLAVTTLSASFGKGLYLTTALLWLTRQLGFSAASAGLALTIAGACGLAATLPAGRLADHLGSRTVLIALLTAQAACTALYTQVSSYPSFLLLACVAAASERGASAARAALYAHVLPTEIRGTVLGLLRALLNCGIGAGAGAGALVLVRNTPAAYTTALLTTAGCLAAAAWSLRRVPSPDGARGRPVAVPSKPPLRDLPYLAVTGLNAIVNWVYVILEVLFPLWVVDHTDAPHALVGPLLMTNTVLVVILQVRATRSAGTLASARRSFRAGGLMVAACAPVAALASYGGPAVASLAMVAAVVLLTLGEVRSQAGSWTLGYDLAPPTALGTYQGIYQFGISGSAAIGPALLTALVLEQGLIGWAALAAVLAAAACAMPPAARWAERNRPPVPGPRGAATDAPA
ncbi:MFS transporter [Streptomyces sp. NPDC002530]